MDEYEQVLRSLRERGVRFLVVGVFGINLHAGPHGPVISTKDCALLLPADPTQLGWALDELSGLGFELEAGGEPLTHGDPVLLAGIVRSRACVRATRDELAFDLPLEIAGASFDELWSRRSMFELAGAEVPVAPLDAMLRSKQLADRPKDRLFLETYRSELEDLLRRELAQRDAADFEVDEDRGRDVSPDG